MRIAQASSALLAVATFAGCGTGSSERDATVVVERFQAALAARDGHAACVPLTPAMRAALERQEMSRCGRALLRLRLRGGGDVVDVKIYLNSGLAEVRARGLAFSTRRAPGGGSARPVAGRVNQTCHTSACWRAEMRAMLVVYVRENSLSLVFLSLCLAALVLQAIAGHSAFNGEQDRVQGPHISLLRYVFSSSYGVSVMENWQSEYLQFTLFILLTVWLLQKGSPESKQLDRAGRETDREQLVGRHAGEGSPRWAG